MLALLQPKSLELRRAFAACRGHLVAAIAFSLAINLLYLASPLYMLQIYDRVVSSGSVVTLVMLTAALLVALAVLAALDAVRARILTRAGLRIDRLLAGRVVGAAIEVDPGAGPRAQPLRDFDTLRQFIGGSGIHALFDLPWVPIYLGVIFLLHPLLGAFAAAGAVGLLVLALANQALLRRPLAEGGAASARASAFAETSLRNAEAVRALGMLDALAARMGRDRDHVLSRQTAAADRGAAMASLVKFVRLALQSAILGLGAYLAIERLTTVGAIFAGSILLGRALQPVEQVVGAWRTLAAVRGASTRLSAALDATAPRTRTIALPRPHGHLSVENLNYVLPGTRRFALQGVSFALAPGEVLGIVGPSGAGKSTLARHLVGVLRPTSGNVRLDDADIAVWSAQRNGRPIGYLPQDVELFADTVAANISRFEMDRDADVVRAATLAGAHDLILRLSDGYATPIGDDTSLSAGYRQRIALARAVFGDPSLVVLDEPSSNLDAAGDSALTNCIAGLKAAGTTVVVVSHRPATLAAADKILVLRDGTVEAFGERNQVLLRLAQPAARAVAPAEPRPAVVGG